ncbi:MAG: class I SAM-dependent methyltransferase [Phycisphaerales bacterium]
MSVGTLVVRDDEGEHRFGTGAGPAAQVAVHDPRAWASIVFGGSNGAAESYIARQWDVDSLATLIELLLLNYDALVRLESAFSWLGEPWRRISYRLERNSRNGARKNIEAHYDLSNEFFACMLDPTMMYSCAIFDRPDMTLEDASRTKLERICQKLDLNRDDHVVEIGTGWGGFAEYAARRYGCRVTTTTISPQQFEYAQRRIENAGLSDRVTVLEEDYRDLEGEFDKLVSIEMIEAIGWEYYGEYFGVCDRLLKRDGLALIQAITIRDQFYERAKRRRDFLKQYIFPGSCLPSITALSTAMSRTSELKITHLEDIGPHYATTLSHWRSRYHENRDAIESLGFDNRFERLWMFYLGYCEGAFRARHVGDVQLLLARPRSGRSPVLGDLSEAVAP